MSNQTVWVVTIELAETIVAVGTSEAMALFFCAARALEYLENRDVLDNSGDHYNSKSLVSYFGYRATECELDGIGEIH